MDERHQQALKNAAYANAWFMYNMHNLWQKMMAGAAPPKLTPKLAQKPTGRKQKRKRNAAHASEESKQETAKKQKKEDKPETVVLVSGEEKAPDTPDDVQDAPEPE